MKRFTELFVRLDQTNATNAKVEALVDYFDQAPSGDAAWAVFFLTGRRLKRLIKRAELRQWVLAAAGYSEWLLEETYQSVGDMAETIALLLPEPAIDELDETGLANWVERIKNLAGLDESGRETAVREWWSAMPNDARFVLNKMLTGAFRVGVSQRLVIRALARHFELETAVIAHRMMGQWTPDADWFDNLGDPDTSRVSASTPYPFYLASPLDGDPEQLGPREQWQVEWKWDGIRAQILVREGRHFIWSRGEELLEGRFPEIEASLSGLPDGTVLDGEILAWRDGAPLPFATLQRRIGRLKPGARLLEEAPVRFLAYDLLEWRGEDWRQRPLSERRARLDQLLGETEGQLGRSQVINSPDWAALTELRTEARERGVEGFMLKALDSVYGVGRQRGHWWKWKIDPYTVDAVLLYAQPGTGRRSNQLTDYTFAVWTGTPGDSALVPVCKAYSGLDHAEIRELDRWIRRNTRERFGPVRSVEPLHVFEIAFEGIAPSSRHKSGVAFRFPRISRWRRDLALNDADTLDQVRALLPAAP